MKRAHLNAVAFGREILGQVEARERTAEALAKDPFARLKRVHVMTPARFDVLSAIFNDAEPFNPRRGRGRTKRILTPAQYQTSQASICRTLGLHRSTVSKMITRLIELGLLENQPRDGRVRMVSFTERGLRLFREALQILHGERELIRLFRKQVWTGPKAGRRRRWKLHKAVDSLFQTVKRVARRLGDTSVVLYSFRRTGVEDRQSPGKALIDRHMKDLRSGRFMQRVRRASARARARQLLLSRRTVRRVRPMGQRHRYTPKKNGSTSVKSTRLCGAAYVEFRPNKSP